MGNHGHVLALSSLMEERESDKSFQNKCVLLEKQRVVWPFLLLYKVISQYIAMSHDILHYCGAISNMTTF